MRLAFLAGGGGGFFLPRLEGCSFRAWLDDGGGRCSRDGEWVWKAVCFGAGEVL
jgi:hypothetical protein